MTDTADNDISIAFRGRVGQFAIDATFTAPASGVTVLFGPSGSGKTTVLRCIAGLQHLPGGRCTIAGQVWQDHAMFLPPHRRSIGYVFQEASLFGHLSVRQNLLFAHPGHRHVAIGFDEVVALLGIETLLHRAPKHLSGGERQRVAIGRALLSQPRLLLMDEPLSALDHRTKNEILPYLERLHASMALPVIYVSHDLAEVERLADHLVLMQSGRVIATGPIDAIQSDPRLPLAQARDAAVSLDAVVESYDTGDGIATLAVAGGQFHIPTQPLRIGTRHRLRIPAGDVSLARTPQHSTILNVLPVTILTAADINPHEITAVLGLGDGTGSKMLARVSKRSWNALELAPGMKLYGQVKGVALVADRSDS